MTGSTLTVILVPVAAAIGLAALIGGVMIHASRRPDAHGPGSEPGQPVVGGIIRGDPRQMTADPHRPATPDAARQDTSEDEPWGTGRGEREAGPLIGKDGREP